MIKLLIAISILTAGLSVGRPALRDEVLTGSHFCGSYMPYEWVEQDYSPVPEGFKPFYVSHFGRHGSRYHNSLSSFKKVSSIYEKAAAKGLLTEEGERQKALFDEFHAFSKPNIGQLSDVGRCEHREIAARMAARWPEVFAQGHRAYAVSSKVGRVRESMKSFDRSLEKSGISIEEHYGDEWQWYVAPITPEYKAYFEDGEWKAVSDEFQKSYDPAPLVRRLVKSESVFKGRDDEARFARALFAVATGVKAAGSTLNLLEPFSEDDLFALWEQKNLTQYLGKGPSAVGDGIALSVAVPLLQDIIDRADRAIASGEWNADLRFGHGEGIMPLTGLMGIEGFSEETADAAKVSSLWQDWKTACLASNVQMVFYRNAKGKVLVKTLLNEREVSFDGCRKAAATSGPYYEWKTLKAFLEKRIKQYKR
ncbi:MAG: hypothetical protein PUB45_07790 [Bacteroidales bacterium]|nr:hypothetical protein [Bacteroidales bacterium]